MGLLVSVVGGRICRNSNLRGVKAAGNLLM